MADKSLLIGDAAADALVEVAALVARLSSGDSVTLRGIGIDGEEITASFLLNSGTVMISESTFSNLPEPDNSEQVEYMRAKIAQFEGPGAQASHLEDPLTSGD